MCRGAECLGPQENSGTRRGSVLIDEVDLLLPTGGVITRDQPLLMVTYLGTVFPLRTQMKGDEVWLIRVFLPGSEVDRRLQPLLSWISVGRSVTEGPST